jgi:hypothetical protein
MKNLPSFGIVLLLISLAVLACGSSAPTEAVPQVEANASTEPNVETATVTSTASPVPPPTPTTAKLQLEIVQSQAWADRDGNVRVNVLMRNPYDFPVAPGFGGHASLLNKAGEFMRAQDLYFFGWDQWRQWVPPARGDNSCQCLFYL